MGLVWSVRYEDYGDENCFFVLVLVGEGQCRCVFHCERRYCDNWDYSYLVEGVRGVMGPISICDDSIVFE